MGKKARLYIVDDEMMAVQYFKSLAGEASYANEVVGEAFQGQKALEEIEKLNPDIIFADISMPVMNGLELAERLLKRNPGRKIVLLTSYRDFDFVKRGLELGVCSYLLKNEMTAASLDKEIARIMEQRELEKKKAHTYVEYNLKQFLTANVTLENEQDYIYGTNTLNRFALVLLVKRRPVVLDEAEGGLQETSCPFDAAEFEEADYPDGILCRNAIYAGADKWCAIFFIGSGVSDSEGLLKTCAERMLDIFGPDGTAACMVSRGTKHFLELPVLYRELEGMSRRLFFHGEKTVLFQRELEGCLNPGEKVDKKLMELIRVAQARERGRVLRTVCGILEECGGCYSQAEYAQVLRSLRGILLRFAREKSVDDNRLPVCGVFTGPEQVQSYFEELVDAIFDCLELSDREQYSRNVTQILDYIHQNYGKNLAVSDIARAVQLSEGHVRKCFKNEVGITVVDYLTEYRIGQAKELMRQGVRITDVYERVGFASSQYFSVVFKKTEGISPSEYIRNL